MVDVELFQTGEIPQTEVLQLLNVVLLQVQSHQAAKRGQAHGDHLNRQEETVFRYEADLERIIKLDQDADKCKPHFFHFSYKL